MSVVSASEVVGYTTGISLDSVVVAELLVWVSADDVVVVDFQAEVVGVAALEWETEKQVEHQLKQMAMVLPIGSGADIV